MWFDKCIRRFFFSNSKTFLTWGKADPSPGSITSAFLMNSKMSLMHIHLILQWCIGGDCVYDERAPEASGTFIYLLFTNITYSM